MKRIGLLAGIGAITLAMIIPASVSADTQTYGAHIDKAVCTNHGGQYGFGKVQLQMSAWGRNDVAGQPSPNYIRIVGRMDQKVAGIWIKGGAATVTTPSYPDGTGNLYPDLLGQAWHFRSADHPRSRMVMRVEFWDVLPSGDVRLAKISARTEAC